MLYVGLAVVAGFSTVYVWGVMERTYNGWPHACFLVSIYYPGIIMAIFTLLNMAIHHTGTGGCTIRVDAPYGGCTIRVRVRVSG